MKTLKYKNFIGSVDFSLEDDCLFGQLLFIRDTVMYHADSLPELRKAFEEAVDQYVADCESLGREPNKVLSGTFNIRIGGERHRKLSCIAHENGRNLNEEVINAIDCYFRTFDTSTFAHDDFMFPQAGAGRKVLRMADHTPVVQVKALYA